MKWKDSGYRRLKCPRCGQFASVMDLNLNICRGRADGSPSCFAISQGSQSAPAPKTDAQAPIDPPATLLS